MEFNSFWDTLKRNSTALIIIAVSIMLLSWYYNIPMLPVVLTVIMLSMLAVSVAHLVLFAYTNLNFTKGIIYGEDGKLNAVEAHSLMEFAGKVFIGVCMLIIAVFVGHGLLYD